VIVSIDKPLRPLFSAVRRAETNRRGCLAGAPLRSGFLGAIAVRSAGPRSVSQGRGRVAGWMQLTGELVPEAVSRITVW
jgi:hypothetical protein